MTGYDDIRMLGGGQNECVVAALDESEVLSDDSVDVTAPFLGISEDPPREHDIRIGVLTMPGSVLGATEYD